MRRRTKQRIIVSALLALFVVVLAVWVGNPKNGHKTPLVKSTFTPTPSVTATSPTPSPTPSPTAAGVTLPPVSGVQLYGPGVHTVVLTISSNSTLSAIGYVLRNGKRSLEKRGTAKSYTITEQVEGGAPLAIIAGQVAYYGTEATCSITVDGTRRITKTVHGAYHVVVCIA